MKTSETIIKIIPALLEAQKKIESVTKEADNPYFKSKYADLNSLMEACKKILNDNGILILQPVTLEGVETILIHNSGEWLSSITKIVCKSDNNPQDQGSAITYARRYGLQSMLFMSAEDDDGEKATDHKTISPSPLKQTKTDEVVREPIKNTDGDCEVCGATLEFKTGTTKDGKKYQGFFCPNSKVGEKHTVTDFKYI